MSRCVDFKLYILLGKISKTGAGSDPWPPDHCVTIEVKPVPRSHRVFKFVGWLRESVKINVCWNIHELWTLVYEKCFTIEVINLFSPTSSIKIVEWEIIRRSEICVNDNVVDQVETSRVLLKFGNHRNSIRKIRGNKIKLATSATLVPSRDRA